VFDIDAKWLNYEIHPDTPLQGVLLAKRFSADQLTGMFATLRKQGEELGISFGDLTLLANSRLAMQASEFARDQGKFSAFHDALFHAYFTELRDIGDMEVITAIGRQVTLDARELQAALQENRYLDRLQAVSEEAQKLKITAAPTFLVNGEFKIVGALPLATLRNSLLKIEGILSSRET
jgi:predicted DsbA family dithiol-disulfide isomerase